MTTGAPQLTIPYSSNPYPSHLHSKETAQTEESAQIKSLKKSTNMIHCNLPLGEDKDLVMLWANDIYEMLHGDEADCVSHQFKSQMTHTAKYKFLYLSSNPAFTLNPHSVNYAACTYSSSWAMHALVLCWSRKAFPVHTPT